MSDLGKKLKVTHLPRIQPKNAKHKGDCPETFFFYPFLKGELRPIFFWRVLVPKVGLYIGGAIANFFSEVFWVKLDFGVLGPNFLIESR